MTVDEYIDYYKKNGYIKEMRKFVGHAPIMSITMGRYCCKNAGTMVAGQS